MFTLEEQAAINEYLALTNHQFKEELERQNWEFDSLEQKHFNGELCFIGWPYMTIGDMNTKAEFYAERDEWNTSVVGASD